MKYLIIYLAITLFSGFVNAADKNCGNRVLTKVYVQAERVSGSPHENKLIIGFDGCPDVSLGHIENTSEAYNSILSIALAAYISKQPVRVLLDDSKNAAGALRIQYLAFD